jgi:toxin ParE1/3/4
LIAKVRRHLQVENDILDLASYIARESQTAGYRFLDAVEETVSGLAYMPGKGSPKRLRGRGLSGIRSWAVRGFPNHLILYDLRPDGVYVLAIVQGSRRYSAMLRRRAGDG